MPYISKRNRRREKEVQQALNNRLELVKEGFTRRDLIKMGLMSTAGILIPKGGLTHAQVASSSYGGGSCYNGCDVGCSPQPNAVFVDPLPIPPSLARHRSNSLTPRLTRRPDFATKAGDNSTVRCGPEPTFSSSSPSIRRSSISCSA